LEPLRKPLYRFRKYPFTPLPAILNPSNFLRGCFFDILAKGGVPMTIFGVDIASEIVIGVVGFILGVIFDEIRSIPARRREKRRTNNLLELTALFREGTDLRNQGWHDRAQTDYDAWHSEWQGWHSRMIAKAREVDTVRAEHVDTLGTFDIRSFHGITDPQALRDLSEFTETLERLDEFLGQS